MRKIKIGLMAVLFVLVAPLSAQDNSAQANNFAGTWQGSFKGTVFCVLRLNADSGISGTLSPGKIATNEDGDLTEAEPSSPDATYPILNPKIDGKVLSFEWKEDSGDEVLKLEMNLTGNNEAEMRFVGEDRIKPIRLQRAR